MLAIVLAAFLRVGAASADEISDKQAQAVQLASELSAQMQRMDALSNLYDQQVIKANALDVQVSQAQAALVRTQQQVNSLRAQVRAQAVAAFISGGTAPNLQVILGSNQDNLMLRQHYLEAAAGSEQDSIDNLHIAYEELQVREAALRSYQAAAHAAVIEVSNARAAAATLAVQQQATLSQVKGQLATLVSQAQQAKALQRAQQLQARLGGSGGGGSGGGSFAQILGSGRGGAAALAAAESFLGVPYSWGGSSRSGVDCSGLMMLAWEAAGVGLDHFTGSQYGSTTHVSLSDLQPGDLVFYGSDISHVAMYAGNGTVIEALTTGTNVGYYPIGYAGSPVGASRP